LGTLIKKASLLRMHCSTQRRVNSCKTRWGKNL